jgi:ribose 5-phosphate isomerase B
MKVAIFCDPVHQTLKDYLIDRLSEEAHQVNDLGCSGDQHLLHIIRSLISKTYSHGILLSDNAHTAAIFANRFPDIRAVVCADVFAARTATTLSNANLVVLNGDAAQPNRAWDILRIWLAGELVPHSQNGHASLLHLIKEIDRLLDKSERSAALLSQLDDTRTPI